MNVTAWVLAPVAVALIVAVAAVLVVIVAVKGTAPSDRATVLKAVAEVIRAIRGTRR
ncbi:hypothetical protein [Streptomyces hoynatensis]|uniref:hypothetical protein n=1 Tax=Streptomyces hoynatensis TaxID=1141874 RepID=UPI001319B8BD|nr:hypothetical protein [Streptomyces hoynatensis]